MHARKFSWHGFVMLDMLLIPITGVVSGTHVC